MQGWNYGGTFHSNDKVFKHSGLSFKIIDTTDLDAVEQSVTPAAKAMRIESPANPLLSVADIAAVAQIAKAHDMITVVDNTLPHLVK